MKIQTNNFSYISFSSRNSTIRTADQICRNIKKEFPAASNTRLKLSPQLKENDSFTKYKNAISDIIGLIRDLCNDEKEPLQTFKRLSAIKTLKCGNCEELSSAACTALKINGYDKARMCYLYAVNPYTQEIKDLDHVVATVNIELPKNYHIPDITDYITLKHLIKPKNQTIIIDAWGGFAEYGKNLAAKYKTEALLSTKIDKYDTIYLLPREEVNFSLKETEFLKHSYPNLLLKKEAANISQEEIDYFSNLYSITEADINQAKCIKSIYKLKAHKTETPIGSFNPIEHILTKTKRKLCALFN